MRNSPPAQTPIESSNSQRHLFPNYQILFPANHIQSMETSQDQVYNNLKHYPYYYPYLQHPQAKKYEQLQEQLPKLQHLHHNHHQQQQQHHHHQQQHQHQQQQQNLQGSEFITQHQPIQSDPKWEQRVPYHHQNLPYKEERRQEKIQDQPSFLQNGLLKNTQILTDKPDDVNMAYESPNKIRKSSPVLPEGQYEYTDEDDNSDFEEEERLREIFILHKDSLSQRSMTSSLLHFTENVTTELQKYLSRTKDQEDSCDIYEDKWATTKSGRELYYADLVRIAQGDSESFSKSTKKGSKLNASSNTMSSSPSSDSASPRENHSNDNQFTGVREASCGLGPLEDLFEFGLKKCTSGNSSSTSGSRLLPLQPKQKEQNFNRDENLSSNPQNKRKRENDSFQHDVIPMHERSFPESFWNEPKPSGVNQTQDSYRADILQRAPYLNAQKLPDFTDLMERWQGEDDENSNEEKERRNRFGTESVGVFSSSLQTLN